jgi:hypothetical protein
MEIHGLFGGGLLLEFGGGNDLALGQTPAEQQVPGPIDQLHRVV